MSLLPAETWTNIVKLHSNYKEWLALSTTSSFFRQIAQAALYESVALRRHLHGDADCVENLKLARFARSLEERPELALFIRSLLLANDSIPSEGTGSHRDHPILRNLAAFPLLRRLQLRCFLIDEELCSSLYSHPRLTEITFRRCNARSAGPDARLLQALPANSISTMNILQGDGLLDAHAWAAVIPVGLRSLAVSVVDDVAFLDTLLSCLAMRGGPTALASLFIRATSRAPPSLLTILISSPQLLSFSLYGTHSYPDYGDHMYSLPMDAIPLLEDFRGPGDLCATFIRGRPVHSVELVFNNNSPVNVLTSLQLSTVPVTSIEFAGSFVNHPYLTYAPVSTVYFGWSEFVCPATAATVLSSAALSRLKNLIIISGFVRWTTAQESAKFVKSSSETCPSIEEFDFGEEKWLMHKDTGWECFPST